MSDNLTVGMAMSLGLGIMWGYLLQDFLGYATFYLGLVIFITGIGYDVYLDMVENAE